MEHEMKLLKQRERRAMNGNAYTRKYEKTINGFLMRAFRNMQSRATGVQKKKAHLYAHCGEIPSRELFYSWSKGSESFERLWTAWKNSGNDTKLTPSVDRIDSGKGYSIENMQWITHSQNSAKANRRRLDCSKVR